MMRIRYFPHGVDVNLFCWERKKLAHNGGHHADKKKEDLAITWRISAAARCQCNNVFRSWAPEEAGLRSCPMKISAIPMEQVQCLIWSRLPLEVKVGLVMCSGFPLMSCLAEGYYCPLVHLAIMFCHQQVVTHDTFKLSREDSLGNTALMMLVASPRNYTTYIRRRLKNMRPDDAAKLVRTENADGLTALHFAALRAKLGIVQLLLDMGADPNAGSVSMGETKVGLTPLHLSLMHQGSAASSCCEALLKENADIGIEMLVCDEILTEGCFRFECDCGGCWSRTIKGFNAVLPKYVTGNTNVNIRSVTALSIAMAAGDQRKAEAMLLCDNENFNINVIDDKGMSPLSYAVLASDIYIAELLLRNGANIHAKPEDLTGKCTESPLELARRLVAREGLDADNFDKRKADVVASLQRLLQLTDTLNCRWCERQVQEPFAQDNVSDAERQMRTLLEKCNTTNAKTVDNHNSCSRRGRGNTHGSRKSDVDVNGNIEKKNPSDRSDFLKLSSL